MVRIVVADDHELMRNGIKATLDSDPHLTVCGMAKDGREAITKVLELKPDLVILDLSMPVLNGFQAILEIRRAAPAVRILILTVCDAQVVEQVSYLLGAHAYLKKNATGQELISAVNSILDGDPALLPAGSNHCALTHEKVS